MSASFPAAFVARTDAAAAAVVVVERAVVAAAPVAAIEQVKQD